ncbi:MAG: DNA-processing protein DprA [Bacteroides sp.]|nr:DNA-processing protein DprA [Bacillota bacterium]MCM1394142.1 DNA-processing protein DprA [[Eubacterium] siraeum]MCM1455180.1 DNA-processing protein DprA [Bacteroides sp.]
MDNIDSTTKILLALAYVEELAYKKKFALLKAVDDIPSEILKDRKAVSGILGADKAKEFFDNLDRMDDIIAEMKKNDVHWISYLDKDSYPELLANIPDPPIMLFVKGNAQILQSKCIAVVGSRKATRYGEKVAEDFSREFARAGVTVVSGFARGIDGIAHKACVASGSPTVAVFACGLDVIYPAEHKGLMEGILTNGGAIVSEYPLGTKPLQYHFPERNRIISGLSKGVFLAQAAKRSGSLITMRIANDDQGRSIFAVPGNVYAAENEGGNELLRECPHALVISPDDVLDGLGIKREGVKKQVVEVSLVESQILEALRDDEKHFEELLEITELGVSELTSTLFNLTVNGLIQETGGNYYSLSGM